MLISVNENLHINPDQITAIKKRATRRTAYIFVNPPEDDTPWEVCMSNGTSYDITAEDLEEIWLALTHHGLIRGKYAPKTAATQNKDNIQSAHDRATTNYLNNIEKKD